MKKLLYILIVAFILIQFFQIGKTNPALNKGMDFLEIKNTPEKLATQIRASCYDCHSNETQYPWYSYIQPAGWFLNKHIEEGRKELNFSTFATYELKRQAHKLDEAAEYLESGRMPLESYLLMHSEAKLTEEQRKEIAAYFRSVQQEIKTANNLPDEAPKPERPH